MHVRDEVLARLGLVLFFTIALFCGVLMVAVPHASTYALLDGLVLGGLGLSGWLMNK